MLHIHRAVRADVLAGALAEMLSAPAGDPFAPEVVAVPTRGMERWLTQRMSGVLGARPGRADGVCANVEFPSPHRLLTDAVAVASGIDPDDDPWLPERAVWSLLGVVQESLSELWLSTLARYLGADETPPDPVRQARRLTALRHVSTLFDRYALHRPGMLATWRGGRDADAHGHDLPSGGAWQAGLWRRLHARMGVPDLAERTADACRRMREHPEILPLPARISLFGLTRLPAGHLEILRAVAAGREVHLFLLHPSPALWERVAAVAAPNHPGDSAAAPHHSGPATVPRRADDRTADLPANRLLASWGRDAREMQAVLLAGAEAPVDHDHPAPPPPDTLLGRLQSDIRADRPPPGPPLPGTADARPALAAEDRSIEIHSCHGRARQVEVVRDAVLHALAEDPSLEPRDVIVMCPDIETFAPLIQATFGAAELADQDGDGAGPPAAPPTPAGPAAPAAPATPATPAGPAAPAAPATPERPADLRVRLADRSLRQTNPVLGVVAALLDLAEERVTASQMLDLADRAPVRRRFRLDDDDLTRLQDWIAQAGIRWGLSAAHRARYKLQTLDNGTWEAGLDRLLLGVTMTEDGQRLFADVLPLDDVDSRSIDRAGRFAELVSRTQTALDALGRPQPLTTWAEAIAEAADALTDTSPRDRWQRAELQRVLDDLVSEATEDDSQDLAPAEVRALLAERLAGRPTRANFRTGHLTVCTLMPMRSVPHRVVCLLGLDDGAFPRKAPRDGDDLMLADPLIGERDPRSEDRQLLLDALMAATERLIVTYTGNDERTNAHRPPAVPVGELLDTIDATVSTADGAPARDRVVVRHPLQPFDPRNFTPGALARTDAPWSFDTVSLAGARALAGTRAPAPPLLTRPLPPRPDPVVELDDLVRFLEHPVKAFLRQRLGIGLRGGADEIEDGLPVELDHLERWGVGQRLLDARLRGVDERAACLAEIHRGTLPPGVLGHPVINELALMVRPIVTEADKVAPDRTAAAGDPVDVRVELPDGRLLSGTVAGVAGDVLLTTTFSRVSARHRIGTWARLLALTASCPERPFAAATVGRGNRDDVRVAWLAPLGADTSSRLEAATARLVMLVELFDRGMREPLPLFCRTSEAYAAAARAGQDPVAAATREWETEWEIAHEDSELEHQMAFGRVLTFDEVLELRPLADPEAGFVRCAAWAWDELLAHEQVSAR